MAALHLTCHCHGSSAQRSPESNQSSIHMYKTMQEWHGLNASRVAVARRATSIVLRCQMDQLWNLMQDPQHVQLFLNFWHDNHRNNRSPGRSPSSWPKPCYAASSQWHQWPYLALRQPTCFLLSCMVKWNSSIPLSIANVSKRTPSNICRKSLMPIWSHPILSRHIALHCIAPLYEHQLWVLHSCLQGLRSVSRCLLHLIFLPCLQYNPTKKVHWCPLHRFGTVNPLHGLSKVSFPILLLNPICMCKASCSLCKQSHFYDAKNKSKFYSLKLPSTHSCKLSERAVINWELQDRLCDAAETKAEKSTQTMI